jgi:pimeloyl-ACP methyl ester carboxylesterase
MKRLSTFSITCSLAALLGGCAVEADIGDMEDPGLDIEQTETSTSDPCATQSCKEPTIWIHGCPVAQINAEIASHFTDAQRQVFLADGYPSNYLYRFVYQGPQCDSNVAVAQAIADYVKQVRATTGAARVNIVAHSIGSNAARLYLAFGGYRYVRHFVAIAGANHGSLAAQQGGPWQDQFGYPAFEGAKEMYPPYACWGEAWSGEAANIQWWVNGCLTTTGRRVWADETPREDQVDYLSIWNTIDEAVLPHESACLNQSRQNDCASSVNAAVTVPPGPGPCGPTGCPGHVAMLWDPGVMQRVLTFMNQ